MKGSASRHLGIQLTVVSLIVLAVSGCQPNEVEPSSGSMVPPGQSAEPVEPPQPVSVVPSPLPPNVSAQGVVLATVIIATGNVSSAIEQGLISPQEVDLAREAIGQGATSDWIDAANQAVEADG